MGNSSEMWRLPFVSQEFRHAGKGPATTVRVTNKRSFTLENKKIMPRNHKCKLPQRQILGTNAVFSSSLPVWLLRWIFRRQALSYCLLHPGKEQEKSSCSLKWARLWEKRALTVMNVFSQPEQRKHKPCSLVWQKSHTTAKLVTAPGHHSHWSK